jgi:hypothetical protein
LEILASANYDIRSGRPQARQVLFTGGRSIRSITLNVDPLGSIALPRTHVLDVRLAKRVGHGGSRSIEIRGDIYNVLNKGTVTNRNLLSGADYLRPLAAGQANPGILFPRILQAGLTFTY